MQRTAAALVIGNEILTGKVQDTNVALLARELFLLGVELRRVVICQDLVEIIADDLDALRTTHDFVITSGGIGPTHDDVTIAAVARSFGRQIVRSAELEAKIRELVGERCNDGHLRMANIPEDATLLQTPDVPWPTILVDNVFVLPGLPKVFELKIPLLREHIGADSPFLSHAIYTTCRETDIADLLDRLDAEHGDVNIGSYPVHDQRYRVRLTFDSKDQGAIDRAVRDVLEGLPEGCIVEP